MPYATGLKNFHFAPLTQDNSGGTTYDAPVKLSEAISASVEPNVATGKLHGDDGAVATASKFNSAAININATTLSADDEALLFGKSITADGVLQSKGSAPYGAFGFEVTMDDGTSEYWWLLKGKFQEPSRSNNTSGDSIEFSTPTVAGEFIPRKSDGEWKFVGNDNNTNFSSGDTWFDAVYDAPPEV